MATAAHTNDSAAPQPLAYVTTSRTEVIKVVIMGVVAGIVIPLLTTLIANYFIEPVFCHGGDGFNICASGGVVANHIAAIIVAFIAFAVLSHWMVYRTLLLVVAVTIAMWGFKKYADPLGASVVVYYLFSALLYGLSFVAFYWILRIRNFAVGAIVALLAVAAACWAWVA